MTYDNYSCKTFFPTTTLHPLQMKTTDGQTDRQTDDNKISSTVTYVYGRLKYTSCSYTIVGKVFVMLFE